jgi:RHS repeat-associated protein
LGRRVQKTVSTVVSKFVFDGLNTAQEKDSKNKIGFNELDGLSLDQVFSRTPASGTANYLLTDALGSAVGLADTSGVVGTSYTYEPFGKTTVSGTSNTNPFGFTGRENDSTGTLSLYNYRARSYSPTLQRFLMEDPVGLAGSDANLYQYGQNAPTIQTDRLGLCSKSTALGVTLDSLGAFFTAMESGHIGPALGSLPAAEAAKVAASLARTGGLITLGLGVVADFANARCNGGPGRTAAVVAGGIVGGIVFTAACGAATLACAAVGVLGVVVGRAGGASQFDMWDWIIQHFNEGFEDLLNLPGHLG